LAVKSMNNNNNAMKSNENIKKQENDLYELTLEKRPSDDAFFILQNRESHAIHEEGNYVNSDSFFGLCHYKTSKYPD